MARVGEVVSARPWVQLPALSKIKPVDKANQEYISYVASNYVSYLKSLEI